MEHNPSRFVACGMYAFTGPQRAAWQQLFDRFLELSDIARDRVLLRFEHGEAILREPGMWFGHTCGYPLVSYLQDDFSPFCVPLFDVTGCAGKLYCSRIIVGAESTIQSLRDCRGRAVAMNNADSNSGMNVLRHAVADMHESGVFFSTVINTGGHLDSVEAVADGSADVAAIDCVSYRLIADWRPELAERVRVIADSVQTTGLPLVMARTGFDGADAEEVVARLGRALDSCDESVRQVLHLAGFAAVRLDDYANVVAAERYAIEHGYPELR